MLILRASARRFSSRVFARFICKSASRDALFSLILKSPDVGVRFRAPTAPDFCEVTPLAAPLKGREGAERREALPKNPP
jgi:hypothetical protein